MLGSHRHNVSLDNARGSTSQEHKAGDRHNVSFGNARGSTSQGHKVGDRLNVSLGMLEAQLLNDKGR